MDGTTDLTTFRKDPKRRRAFPHSADGSVVACAPSSQHECLEVPGSWSGWDMNQPLDNRGALALRVVAGPFGPRLRIERERRRITLDSIAANTKINVGLLKELEHDNVSRWPSGIFRRSFIKAYAQAIGLDPDEVAREFLERFPDQEPVDHFKRTARRPTPVRPPRRPAFG